jgi:hypothetical protein
MIRYPLKPSVPFSLLCLLAACLLLLSGCSAIKVVETWNNPGKSGQRYQKLLILGIGHDENLRSMAENIMVEELQRNGVAAVASHTQIKEIDGVKRDAIVAAVRATGADAVLSIRAVSKGDTTVTQGGQTGGVYGTAMNTGGTILAGARDYSLATLQTNLYDSATAGLVWTATIKTNDAGRVARVSRELARFFLEQLRKDGFL